MVLWQPSPCPPRTRFSRCALTGLALCASKFRLGPRAQGDWLCRPSQPRLRCAALRVRVHLVRSHVQTCARDTRASELNCCQTVTAPTPDTQALQTAGCRISAATHRFCPRRRAWRRRRRSPGAGLRVHGPGRRRTGGCACGGWRGFSRRRQLLSTAPGLGFSFRAGWGAAKLGQRHADAQRCRPGCGQWKQKGGQHFLFFHHRPL